MDDIILEIELVDQIEATIEITDTVVLAMPAAQGLPGVPGRDGGGFVTLTAAIAIGGQRIVTTDATGSAIYADSATLAHANSVLGLSLNAASIGGSVQVQTTGEVTDPSFAFTSGATLWLATNGMIATAAPTTGFSLVIGYAETSTKIFLNIGTPIILT